MTKLAVVILNYNGEQLLRQFLPSVIRYSPEAEIVVADNGSPDGSVAVLQQEFPQVRLIRLDRNYGFCGGYNRALRQVDAQYYLLLNSDVEVTSGWLNPMIEMLDRNEGVAAVQPKILSYHEKNKFEYAGAGGGFIDALGYPFCRGRIFDHVEEDHAQYNDEREIFWATGACFMVRAQIYHHFNGLDEELFAHMEEIDLCWKIGRMHQKVCYTGKSVVYHQGAGTLGYKSPKKTYLNFRNGLILIFKHLDPGELLYKLPLRMGLDWLAAMVFLLKGEAQHAKSVLRAHYHFLRDLGKHRRKRADIRQAYPSYSRKSVYSGLVIFDYYFRSRKRFRSIIPDGTTLS
jgi:GT2 family glycosyltransferase